MTLGGVVTAAVDAAYLAVFAFTLRDYLRRRDPVRRAVVAVFGSLALVLGSSLATSLLPAARGAIQLASITAFLAEPVLVLWLVHTFRPLDRRLRVAALACFSVLAIAAWSTVLGGGPGLDGPAGIVLTIGFLGYFVILELGAAMSFAREAGRRGGASRTRLLTAALATGLLGVAILILIVGSLATAGSGLGDAVRLIVEVIALLSAVGYLAAFAPPRGLRRLSQQTIAYDFLRELNARPDDPPVERAWVLLGETARRATGARRATVRIGEAPPVAVGELPDTPGPGERVIEVPVAAAGHASGGGAASDAAARGGAASDAAARGGAASDPSERRLELIVAGRPLFVEDDLELIELLATQTIRAVEQAELRRDRESIIAELRAANAAKSDFLAAMSHELRTPLNAIIGFSELLREPADPATDAATVAEYAGHIHQSGLHLLELINEILDLARIEAGRLELKPMAVDLPGLLRDIASTMRPLAEPKGLRLEVTAPDDLHVTADPNRMRQIVFNLVSNAIKFTDEGGRVTIAAEADGDEACLSVVDTGRGIAPDELARIFEAFEQGTGGREVGGTGLGLALTRRLVEAHGGRIEVASELGFGSRFTVRLPRPSEQPEASAAPAATPGQVTVLVIEDDPSAGELLRLYLGSAGHRVEVTPSGTEGLAWARAMRPDAIILDILLPDRDGWDVLQALKRDEETRGIPVVVVSVVDDRALGIALGAVDYFVKPIGRDALLASIGRLTFTTKVKTRTVTVLVIDPDPYASQRYRELLEPEGFRVIAALDGRTGLREAALARPDLILLDVLLPDGDGFELVHRLKADPATRSIPIWVATQPDLAPADKERLNGHVLGIAERGDDALAALRSWLNPAPGAPAA
jgi:signal transduction histidine kinase/DNA-binding response OmpR family regulator